MTSPARSFGDVGGVASAKFRQPGRQALARTNVDLLAEEVALLACHATNESLLTHGSNGDSVGTSTALN